MSTPSVFDLSEKDFLEQVRALSQAPASSAARPPPDAPSPPAPPNAYELAASVLAWFDPGAIRPIDGVEETGPDALQQLRVNSTVKLRGANEAAWSLARERRIEALRRLRETQRIENAVKANPAVGDEPYQATLTGLLASQRLDLTAKTPAELAAIFEVVGWLEAAGFIGLPDMAQIVAELQRATLLEPFEQIAPDSAFRGRKNELQRLRDYVGVLPPSGFGSTAARVGEFVFHVTEKPPLLIYGPGGVGKSTLVARFILEHARLPEDRRFPFAYLDFDRPEINESEPLSLLSEAVRQLGVQYPEAQAAASALQSRWRAEFGQALSSPQSSVLAAGDELPNVLDRAALDFAHLIATLGATDQPVVVVLDTLEELQFAVGARLNTIWPLLEAMRRYAPRLRVVLSGRGEIEGRKVDAMPLPGLDRDAAVAYLRARGVPSEEVARRLADRLGGSPLSLKLAADLAQKTDWTGADLPLRLLTFDSQLVQRQLYRRVLEHIHEPGVRQLAHPGLILRRVTAELVLEVLAKPCGLTITTLAEAQSLVDAMGREMSLVSRDPDGALRHRQDLRMLMLELIRSEDPRRFDEIQRRAADFYAPRMSAVEKAEEIYHRLSLNQPRERIDPLWREGVETLLTSAVEEFKGSRRAYLAHRLKLPVDAQTAKSADLEDWESLTARNVAALLAQNQFDAALKQMAARKERSVESPLTPLEARALFLADRWSDALDVLVKGFGAAALESRRLYAFDLALQAADIVIARRTVSRAAEAAVRLAGFDEELGLDKCLAALSRRLLLAQLAQPADASDAVRGQLGARLIAGARRAPADVLTGDDKLGAWIAAAIARLNVVELARLLAIVGVPSAPETELRRLASELAQFDAAVSADPTSPRGALSREFGVPDDVTLTQAWTKHLLQAEPRRLTALVVGVLERAGPRPPDPLLMSISNLMLASLGARRQRRPGRRRAAPLISPSSRPKAAYNQSVLDKVATALSGAFTMAELGELVSRRIDLSVEALSLSADPGAAVADVVATAQAQHWLGELIVAALEARPSDPEIIKAANELGVASLSLPDYPAMPAAAAEALAVLQARTCLIEIDGEPRSTGFLIGRDLVLTSAALAVAPDDDAHDVVARFDYRSGETDGVSSPGVSFFAQVLERNEFDTVREGLGYVLLQLSEPAGILPIGHLEAGSVSALRGWIPLPAQDTPLATGETLVILHHLGGQPLTASVGVVQDGTLAPPFFSYRVNTGAGAGGAPCFDAALALVGLHLGTTSGFASFGCRAFAIGRDLLARGVQIVGEMV